MKDAFGNEIEYQVSVPIVGSVNDQRLVIASCTTVDGVGAVLDALLQPENKGPVSVLIEVRVK